jgi:hypothetical protein
MLIECLQRRPTGQNVHFTRDGTAYSFEDRGNGAQVAVIADREHQQLFLSITEGFRFFGVADDGAAPSIVAGMQPTGPLAADMERAQARRQAPVADEDDGEAAPAAPRDDALPESLPDEAALQKMTMGQLRLQYTQETGKAASPRSGAEVLVAKILANREARGA